MKNMPPFIYRTIDHIYISDSRSYRYSSLFDYVINLHNINKKGDIEKTNIDNINYIKVVKGNEDVKQKITNEIENSHNKTKLLLYSDDINEIITFMIYYLQKRYSFTIDEIKRFFSTSKFPYSYLTQVDYYLT